MKRNTFTKIIAVLLAVSMILTNTNMEAYTALGSGVRAFAAVDTVDEDGQADAPDGTETTEENVYADEAVSDADVQADEETSIEVESSSEYLEDASEAETTEDAAENVTDMKDRLDLELSDWTYTDSEGSRSYSADSDKCVDFSDVCSSEENGGVFHAKLSYSAHSISAGDTFSVFFPESISDIKVSDGFASDGITYEVRSDYEGSQKGTRLTVTFGCEGDVSGKLPLDFGVAAGEEFSIVLQHFSDSDRNEYKVTAPLKEQESVGVPEEDAAADNGEQANAKAVDMYDTQSEDEDGIMVADVGENNFTITGSVDYSDTEWKDLIRPSVFSTAQKIKITARYTVNGEEKTYDISTQNLQSSGDYYIQFKDDGSGGGSFTISNISNYVTIDGVDYHVDSYEVSIDDGGTMPYYKPTSSIISENLDTAKTHIVTLERELNTQNIYLHPTVVGDSENESFTFEAEYKNGSKSKKLSKSVGAYTEGEGGYVVVPVGVEYTITQKTTTGYSLSDIYSVSVGDDSKNMNGSASGTIEEGNNITITTVNYSKNQSVKFKVNWIDNNSAKRPSVSGDIFAVEYATDGENYSELTSESLDNLGMEKLPSIDAVDLENGIYKLGGLTAVDNNGDTVSYRVVVKKVPDNYLCAESNDNGIQVFTLREAASYSAGVAWLDNSDAKELRPQKTSDVTLKLYRRVEDGSYELVKEDVTDYITGTETDRWTVNIPDCPRYNDDNMEYDYVLVQGTIDDNGTSSTADITNYKTYYNNGTSSYGNDISLCHNGGEIREKLYGVCDFTAKKVWKDGDTAADERPGATVTLYRYSLAKGVEDPGIDSMYAQNKAARVIYRDSDKNTDVILSYKLSGESPETIVFNSETVAGLASIDDFSLPQYDELGREYVYFVRESLDSAEYEIGYSKDDTTYSNGTVNSGTITNVRKEKAKVTVNKQWQCPSNLADIAGLSVRVELWAPDSNGDMTKLTVLSSDNGSYETLNNGSDEEEALTISGFTSSIATLSTEFYVNIRDEEGSLYDMSKAVIKEVIVVNDSEEIKPDVNGEFQLKENTYVSSTEYMDAQSDPDGNGGMKYYVYNERNTITGERDYTIVKNWDASISESERANVESVSFTLQRRSSGPNGKYEDVDVDGSSSITIPKESDSTWEKVIEGLARYDDNGYEYQYRAVNEVITFKNGTQKPENWYVVYSWTDEKTEATNYIGVEGGEWLRISKEWDDNGDVSGRRDVKVRVYRRSALTAAFASMTGEVSLNDVDVAYFEYTLTASGMWYRDINLVDIEKDLLTAEGKADEVGKVVSDPDPKGFIFVEYMVGDELAYYAASDMLEASESTAGYSLSGSVKGSLRQYKVETKADDNGNVEFTNSRTGQVVIKVDKRWKDENNKKGTRPKTLQFIVYRDGEPLTELANDNISSEPSENVTVKDGVVTVSGGSTDDEWSFQLNGLPLFSDNGTLYSYDVKESRTVDKYIMTRDAVQVAEDEYIADKVTYTFGFENTVCDTMNHVAYKDWRDAATNGSDRPDLYLTLYRYVEAEGIDSAVEYDNYKEQIWTPAESGDKTPDNDTYDWKIEVQNLPKYDEQGRQYVYLFKEEMNNAGETVHGVYKGDSTTKKNNDSTYEYFVNTLTDEMTISGDKIWLGFKGYNINEEDMPTPTIELYRTLDTGLTVIDKSDAEVEGLIDDGKIQYVTKTVLDKDKYGFVLPDTSSITDEELESAVSNGLLVKTSDGEVMLPKYDENGERYSYIVREKLGAGSNDVTEQLYTKVSVGGSITNTFRSDVNRRNITVTKTWGRDVLDDSREKVYPSVTYYLWRYVQENGKDSAIKIDEATVGASSFSESDDTYSYTFKDLLTYSPAGKLYGYYVTEKPIKGYTTSYTDENRNVDESCNVTSKVDVTTIDKVANVGIKNSYDDYKTVTVSGDKLWDDYGNSEYIYGGRPDSIDVILKRYTENESGQNNKVTGESVKLEVKTAYASDYGKPYIVWTKSSDGNQWHYDIYNLEKYAQNGRPYIYSVEEKIDDETTWGYAETNAVAGSATDNSDKVSLSSITNKFDGSFYVRKIWFDGDDQYGFRPASVTMILQRSLTGTDSWENIGWEESFKGTTLTTATDGEVTVNGSTITMPIVSVKLTSDNVMANTNGNSWEYTFKNLPTKDKNGDKWEYRCIEAYIDDVPFADSTPNVLGAYTKKEEGEGTKTEVSNTLKDTELYVKKVWNEQDKDGEDTYLSRPEQLTFKLQKMSVENNQWVDVYKSGSLYTFTISAKDNWEKTLKNLPVCSLSSDGKEYYNLSYRAVELHTDEESSVLTASGAANYEDITQDSAHKYDKLSSRNESTITNKIITDSELKKITVSKVWYTEDANSKKTAEFELYYKTKNEEGWHSFGENGLKEALTSSEVGPVDDTVEWDNLPKYDREGNELVYKVEEKHVEGYKTCVTTNKSDNLLYATEYKFTNIQLQDYSVEKTWENESYAEKDNGSYTATFKLQQKVGGGEWTDVEGSEQKLSTDVSNGTSRYTWKDLPKYDENGKPITYRAVETEINGKTVTTDNTNGAYVVTYKYGNKKSDTPSFADNVTYATNRMVYGFVNMTKAAAYLAPAITSDSAKLKGVEFKIMSVDPLTKNDVSTYVTGVNTDVNGNLISDKGKYGIEKKYLVSGTYRLVETSSNTDYSIWNTGVLFTVGVGDVTSTGEHGTAWISTGTYNNKLSLAVDYKASDVASHSYGDDCVQRTNADGEAYNIESRGVIEFTKTGKDNTTLDTHVDSTGESEAYFAVYADKAMKQQVAGMKAKDGDKTKFVLTDYDAEGQRNFDVFSSLKNGAGIPYLRKDTDGVLSLLTETYYIKEITPPAGYKLDSVVRTAVVGKIDKTNTDEDLSGVYSSNIAAINGSTGYSWTNEKNKVTLYKRDQYGRNVTLKDGGYLILKAPDSVKFPGGVDEIWLYQDSSNPAKTSDDNLYNDYITYNADSGCWVIEGLFDAEKVYTLSEPKEAVPNNNVKADGISFKVTRDGMISFVDENGEASSTGIDNPLSEDGGVYENTYKADASNNIIVMRDVSRYRKNVKLEKIDSSTKKEIPNISFELYKYAKLDESGNPVVSRPVLKNGVCLTTDENGIIDLSTQKDKENLITGSKLSYGLDVGKYYFKEIEKGASDSYVLSDNIYFDIVADNTNQNPKDYEDYAKIEFIKNFDNSSGDGVTGVVENTPVTDNEKTIELTKVDSKHSDKTLSGARFELTYTSLNNGSDGAQTKTTYNCVTGNDGKLYQADKTWNITSERKYPDISKKGSYVLKEIQATDTYMTYTKSGESDVVTLVTFDVNTNNVITNVMMCGTDGNLSDKVTDIVTGETISEDGNALILTVVNRSTVVSISKLNDIVGGSKTCDQSNLKGEAIEGAKLGIYEGVYSEGSGKNPVWSEKVGTSGADSVSVVGVLKENTIYTLHEMKAPSGYMAADDIYFALFGTVTENGSVTSKLYAWNGSSAPSGSWTSDDDNWSDSAHLKDNVLTMVDEAIIAPVSAQKVIKKSEDSYESLAGAEFSVMLGEYVLGKAVSDSEGYLVWKELTDYGASSGMIFDKSGKRITVADSLENMQDKTIILMQSEKGYEFTETYAPDNAHNNGKSYSVNITEANYKAYRTFNDGKVEYDSDKYVDIVNWSEAKGISNKDDGDKEATADDLVNDSFKTTFVIKKTDAKTGNGIDGVEFTLSYKKVSASEYEVIGTYKTEDGGLLALNLTEKGDYRIAEKSSKTGYILSDEAIDFTVVDDDHDKSLTYDENAKNKTKVPNVDENGYYCYVNERKTTKLVIDKKDSESKAMDGVKLSLSFENSEGTWQYVKLDENGKAETKDGSLEVGNEGTSIVETGETGTAVFDGLPDGEYRLTEISTNAGYNLLSEPLDISIDVADREKKVAKVESKWSYGTETEDVLRLTLFNKRGFALPKTGSETPRLPLPVIPIAVLLESAMLYIYGRRGRRRRKGGGSG